MGFTRYTFNVAIPSVICNRIDADGNLPWDYYESPFELIANVYGNVDDEYSTISKIIAFGYFTTAMAPFVYEPSILFPGGFGG